jgi:hypothetical protein
VNAQQQWASVLSAAASPAVAGPEAVLRTAMELGLSVAPGAAACSVTELTDSGYRTTVSVNELAMALDGAQYDAGTGPCLSAAAHGSLERMDDTAEQIAFPAFRAAAVRRGVRSSLSVPLTGLRRPAALNLYASPPAAFAAERSQAVADLLARCVTRLLSGGRPHPAATAAGLDAARARRSRVEHAQAVLVASAQLSRAEAFTMLTRRSQQQERSVFDIVDDILRGSGPQDLP